MKRELTKGFFTPDEDEIILEMRANGAYWAQIAERLGRGRNSVRVHFLNCLKFTPRGQELFKRNQGHLVDFLYNWQEKGSYLQKKISKYVLDEYFNSSPY